MAAHALAGLVVEFAFLLAYAGYFWDGYDSGRPTGHELPIAGMADVLALCLAVPMVLMFCALVAGPNEGGATRRILTGLGWAAAAVVNLLVLLLLLAGAEQLANGGCGATMPHIPGGIDLMTAMTLCVMAALSVGALISWAVWSVARLQDRPIGGTVLYAVWLTAFAITALLLLVGLFGHFGPQPPGYCIP